MKTAGGASYIKLWIIIFASLRILQTAQAVNPAPDGGYPGGNTAEGQGSLLNLTTGTYNTAIGFLAVESNRGANLNTAVGAGTLLLNGADENTATGAAALLSNSGGIANTANGAFSLFSNTIGEHNTGAGDSALFSNTEGDDNTAVGDSALLSNTTATGNTAIGASALAFNTTGGGNTAAGAEALNSNSTGDGNTALGFESLLSNSTGSYNTATGVFALFNNTTGGGNTSTGASALQSNTTGVGNTAIGVDVLVNNTGGDSNTAIGDLALSGNTVGYQNTAVGSEALENNINGQGNTALGNRALVNSTGSQNLGVGEFAGQDVGNASNVICIGDLGANVDNSCFIGNIRNVQTQNGDAIPVVIDSNRQLGTTSSSRRFKKNVRPMDKASKTILALKPVKFQYKNDKTSSQQFGLIAEDVAKVNPDLVVRDKNGEIYTVRYDAVNAMLLNEFLKEHRVVQEQGETITRQQNEIETLAADLQKLSSHLKLTKAGHQSASKERKTRVWVSRSP